MLKLPIDSILEGFLAAYPKESVLIVQASPGAGKTTRIAPALIRNSLLPAGKKILMLQPRRIAAKATATRIAEENNWNLGAGEVGYHVRFEKRFQVDTKLVIMTEGILSRKLVDDPELKDVACVILDEFHERSLHSDLAVALLKELQSALRPDLKIIVMSATLEEETLRNYFAQAVSYQAEGRVFPLHAIYQPKADRRDFKKRLEEQVGEALSYLAVKRSHGNTLVFLPGVGEIRRTHEYLRDQKLDSNFEILELHGSLSLEEQSRVLKRSEKRRIILSTNVAETSLTVPGVNAVVDSGWVRVAKWDASRNFEKLELSRVSLASAKQRAGRAAREEEGYVYKLWSQDEEHSFKNFEESEVSRVDLSSALLTLAAWGVKDFENFEWFEKPSSSKLKSGIEQLKNLGALDSSSGLTVLGKQLQKIPLPPRLASVLLNAKKKGQELVASLALALLGEKDPLRKRHSTSNALECDLTTRVNALRSLEEGSTAQEAGLDLHLARRILNVAKDLRNAVSAIPRESNVELPLAELLWTSYSDRLCRRREVKSDRALMVGGRGVILSSDSELHDSEFFLALEIMDTHQGKESKVSRATSLSLEQLKKLGGEEIQERIQSQIDFKSFKLKSFRALYFRDLVLDGPYPVANSSASVDSSLDSLVEQWPEFSARFNSLADFERRISFLQKYCPEENIGDLSDQSKKDIMSAALEHARNSSIDSFDVESLLPVFYPKNHWEKLNRLAPKTLLVPSGRHIALFYSEDLATVKCSVKLQELFGWARSPSILKDKIQIAFDLLSPAKRPVQTTKDLASFWKTAYPELRKQLKIQYPKHPWPEDPWAAQATHKTLRALKAGK